MNNIKNKIKKFFINKKFLWLLLPIIAYILFLTFFYENSFFNDKLDGGGIIKKLSFIFFDELTFRKIFIYVFFIFSWFLIFFLIKSIQDKFVLIYFLIIAFITKPFYQEYFDPIIFILLFFFFKISLHLNFSRVFLFYFYHLVFLIGTVVYYH